MYWWVQHTSLSSVCWAASKIVSSHIQQVIPYCGNGFIGGGDLNKFLKTIFNSFDMMKLSGVQLFFIKMGHGVQNERFKIEVRIFHTLCGKDSVSALQYIYWNPYHIINKYYNKYNVYCLIIANFTFLCHFWQSSLKAFIEGCFQTLIIKNMSSLTSAKYCSHLICYACS